MKRNLYLIFLSAITLVSCKTETTNPNPSKPTTTEGSGSSQGTQLVSFEAYYSPSASGSSLWEAATYDASGNVLQKKYRELVDPENTFNKLQIESFTYDATNKKLTRRLDVSTGIGSGVLNMSNETFTYLGNQIVEKKSDYDRLTYTYDNNKINKATHYLTDSGRERLNRNDTYSYNANGYLVSIKGVLTPHNDALEATETYTYEYDDHNNLVKDHYVNNRQGYLLFTYFKRKYDSNNKVIELIQSEYSASNYFKFEITYNDNGTIKSKRVSKAEKDSGPFIYIGDISYTYTYK